MIFLLLLLCNFTVPGEPRKVRVEAINSTSLFVEWEPPLPKEQNGLIRGYQVCISLRSCFVLPNCFHMSCIELSLYCLIDGMILVKDNVPLTQILFYNHTKC